MDGERWRQAEIPPEVQRLTTSLEEGEYTLLNPDYYLLKLMIGLSFNAELMDNHVTANRLGNGLFISPITPSSILPPSSPSLSLSSAY